MLAFFPIQNLTTPDFLGLLPCHVSFHAPVVDSSIWSPLAFPEIYTWLPDNLGPQNLFNFN